MVKGSACYTINGVSHNLVSGDMVFLMKGDMMEAHTNQQNSIQCFEITFSPKYQYAKKIGGGGIIYTFPK
ncbi:MAG: hypothetical protein LBH20_10275 [Treponema sp.]|jgi:quercetin dioxygenase-like cupin family protein|nr:hypothetical protein [Treponema sp.]